MVGDTGAPGRPATELSEGVRAAYDAGARLWAEGPEPVYASLARALLAQAPPTGMGTGLAGGRVLDLGAGTGVAARAALAAGARSVVAADSALGMLRRCPDRLHPVAADATALPFRDGCFDLVLAAFCLGHLDRPVAGLREARRVAARAGRQLVRGRVEPSGQGGGRRGPRRVRLSASVVVRHVQAGHRAVGQ